MEQALAVVMLTRIAMVSSGICSMIARDFLHPFHYVVIGWTSISHATTKIMIISVAVHCYGNHAQGCSLIQFLQTFDGHQ